MDKFRYFMKYMYLRKARNLKYSQGVWTMVIVSAVSNLLLVFLCWQIYSFGEIKNVPSVMDYPMMTRDAIYGSDLQYLPAELPIFDGEEQVGSENISIFFAPCDMTALESDPLQTFMDDYKQRSSAMKNWNLVCFADHLSMEAEFVKNAKP